jgi:hypothetical protein
MKALSIRQPWAELILQGRKTIELRTWTTHHRGTLAVHAAQKLELEDCAAHQLDPDALRRGALVGTVTLVDVIELDAAEYADLRDQHLSRDDWPGKLYGWVLAQPTRLSAPIPMSGRMALFTVDDVPAPPAAVRRPKTGPLKLDPDREHDPSRPFDVVVEPRDETSYALTLYQWPSKANGVKPQPKKVVTVSGVNLQAIADHVIDAIKKSGYGATDLSVRRRAPFRMNEENGVRLGLLFLTVAPLSRLDRMEAISRQLRDMPSEEAYYWYSKCTTPDYAGRAQQALRVLLAAE